jgi:hypothetical protein
MVIIYTVKKKGENDRSLRTYGNLLVQPVPCALVLDGDERAVGTSFDRDAHSSALFGDGLNVGELDVPFGDKLVGPHEHDPIVRQHDDHVTAGKLKMCNVVLVEELAIIRGFEPELTKSFPLRVWSHDTIHSDEACQSNTIQAVLIKNGRSVPDTLSQI